MKKETLGGIAFIAALSVLAGIMGGGPWWLFAAFLVAWTVICAVFAWIGGEWRGKGD